MTRLLYDEDSTIRDFEGTVLHSVERDGATWIELDQTAFYAAGGGQPADRGLIDAIPVVDVSEEDGRVWHRVEGSVATGTRVQGSLDWARRFDHMQQHTGQHILSQAFLAVAGAETRSFHLGAEEVSIDVAHPGPDVVKDDLGADAGHRLYDEYDRFAGDGDFLSRVRRSAAVLGL